MYTKVSFFLPFLFLLSCGPDKPEEGADTAAVIILNRGEYADRLYGFWLGQCIANWTGLVTEMDKVGNIGELRTGQFYTRADWGAKDQPSIWGEGVPSDLSENIDFVLRTKEEIWGSDDDTDIEYIYQYLLDSLKTTVLTPAQIRAGWLKHIRAEEENYLWVANQRALDLMMEGVLPPETGDTARNKHYAMIDAQLTTEIFGLLAPGNPEIALKMADLPTRTVARGEAETIARFYVTMYALAISVDTAQTIRQQLMAMAAEARTSMPGSEYPAKMYDYVIEKHAAGLPWEAVRDSLYVRYQVEQAEGYDITSKNLYCNGCFAAGINYAASLVSLFYGQGDLRETIKIGALAGWDSDNPTATWGGLLGFMLGREGVESAFGTNLSERFNIHRTRRAFPDDGMTTLREMAATGIRIVDRVVVDEMGGSVDTVRNVWRIPNKNRLDPALNSSLTSPTAN